MAKKTTKRTEQAATNADTKLTPSALKQALANLEAGTAGIREAGIALGYKSGAPLRKALREAFGDAAYQKAIDAGRSVRGVAAIGVAAKDKATKPAVKKAPKRAAKKS
jgi:hypothetical protein